jgi:hypothetical protein
MASSHEDFLQFVAEKEMFCRDTGVFHGSQHVKILFQHLMKETGNLLQKFQPETSQI